MRTPVFAANWKMHLGPTEARAFLDAFLGAVSEQHDRTLWFFPGAVALEAAAQQARARPDVFIGAQNLHWEPKGAYTGELSIPMARDAGATGSLVGHSERRHVFGESDEDTGRKVRALLEAALVPMLCVGETIEEREAGRTLDVVRRQLAVLEGLGPGQLEHVLVAYEPVWAIGTGLTATPADAAEVHAVIRSWFGERGVPKDSLRVLYGGSVKPDNIADLLAQSEIDGVLVGGASLKPDVWADMVQVPID